MAEVLERSEFSARRHRPPIAVVLVFLLLPVACTLLLDNGGEVPAQNWDKRRGPVVPHDKFPADCSLCHLGGGWHEIRADFTFDHAAQTGVALNGAHEKAECLRCHNDRGPVGRYAQRGCAGCHEDLHQGRLGKTCSDCHGERDWQPREQIARHNQTRFPLIGAHVAVACWQCHPGAQVGNFQRADIACESCHQPDLARAVDPDHRTQGWVADCQRCHSPLAWRGARIEHSFFPLTGGHAGPACAECHRGNVFQGTPRDCAACHLDDYQRTGSPNHTTAGFDTDCQRCHTINGWGGGEFNHAFFPLLGAHASTDCTQCHQGGVFRGTPRDCVACHRDDYDRTTNPNHATAGFPTNCEQCHTADRWDGANFNHRFPLRGPHDQACSVCHTTAGNFSMFTCLVCHEHRQSAMDDKHREVSGYSYNSQACYNCHPNGRR